jgi:hypothetical protein
MRLLKYTQSIPYVPNLGGLLKLGDTPRPPAESILHLFFSGPLMLYTLLAGNIRKDY